MPDELQDAEFVFPEEVTYDSEGADVPALLYHGKGDDAVINIHGGPNWHVQFLWDPLWPTWHHAAGQCCCQIIAAPQVMDVHGKSPAASIWAAWIRVIAQQACTIY